MANLTAYGTGTPKASDLLLGTKTATPNTNEKNITQNFTVSSVAAFANSYSLGYTVYTAALIQTGATAPVATILQNTTGGTFTWSYTNSGQSRITVSGITLPANKVAIFLSSGAGDQGIGGVITTTTQIDVDQFSSGGGGPVDGMAAGTSIEIRIYI
jgi:hypothetical protein